LKRSHRWQVMGQVGHH